MLQILKNDVREASEKFRHTSRRTQIAVWSILGLIVALLLWHFAAQIFGTRKPKAPPPPPVKVAMAQTKDVTVVEPTIGTVVAVSTVQLTAQVTGKLLTANFEEGQIVHKGQVLFQIDPQPFQSALEQARATLAKDRGAGS